MTRPSLKTRRIARHGREVTIVQPVDHGLLLLDTHIPLPVVGANDMFPQRHGRTFVGRFRVIRLDVSGANQQDVADLDVASLRLRPDVDALGFAACGQLGERDGVVGVWVVVFAAGERVATVVEEDAAADDAVCGPVVHAAFEVGLWAENVFVVRLMK